MVTGLGVSATSRRIRDPRDDDFLDFARGVFDRFVGGVCSDW